MGLDLDYIDGQTPLDEEEKDGLLIPTIATRGELDEFEQQNIEQAIHINTFSGLQNNFKAVQDYILENDGKIFLFLGEGQHKIKRKAEQIACNEALQYLNLPIEPID